MKSKTEINFLTVKKSFLMQIVNMKVVIKKAGLTSIYKNRVTENLAPYWYVIMLHRWTDIYKDSLPINVICIKLDNIYFCFEAITIYFLFHYFCKLSSNSMFE